MTDVVVLRPASERPSGDVAVTVMPGAVGAHVGLLYHAAHPRMYRHLHLEWHFRLRSDSAPPAASFWVNPGLDEFESSDVSASARLIWERHEDGRIPYGFSPDAHFDRAGTLTLGESRGLTCATFVLRVFEHANVPLVETITWDEGRTAERRQEDEAAQARLVSYLRAREESRSHAELVAGEIGCTRVRAEEVAAASGMTGRPVQFLRAEPVGRQVLREVAMTPTDNPG